MLDMKCDDLLKRVVLQHEGLSMNEFNEAVNSGYAYSDCEMKALNLMFSTRLLLGDVLSFVLKK